MKRATTPTHRFLLPFDSSFVEKLLLTYTQNDKIVLEKRKEDMAVDGNVWSVTLTQEESNLFSEGHAYAQIRCLTPGGQALASEKIHIFVGGVFNDEVLE